MCLFCFYKTEVNDRLLWLITRRPHVTSVSSCKRCVMVKTAFSLRFFQLNRLPPFTAAWSHHMITFWHIFRKRDSARPPVHLCSLCLDMPTQSRGRPAPAEVCLNIVRVCVCVCVCRGDTAVLTHPHRWPMLVVDCVTELQAAGRRSVF